MATTFKASERRLLSILLERVDETDDDRAGIDELLAATEALTAGWLVPFGVALHFVHCDPASGFEEVGAPEHAHRFLRLARVHPEVRVGLPLSRTGISIVPVIDAGVIRGAVMHELEQPAPAGQVASLSQMWWTSVRARSPLDEDIELATPYPFTPFTEIIDGARWCLGPVTDGVVGPPAWLRATNSHVTTKILLEIYWDLWCDYAPGRALLDAGIARAMDRGGWQVRQLHPPQVA
jgi:hypothetical protein